MENEKEEIIKLDSTYFEYTYFLRNIKNPKFVEWNDLEHKEKQAKFKESLKRNSEIVAKWPEWKRNVLGIIDWKYK